MKTGFDGMRSWRYHHSYLQPRSVYRWLTEQREEVIYILWRLKGFWICVCKRKFKWKTGRKRFIPEATVLGSTADIQHIDILEKSRAIGELVFVAYSCTNIEFLRSDSKRIKVDE